jgi:hypothetical protein
MPFVVAGHVSLHVNQIITAGASLPTRVDFKARIETLFVAHPQTPRTLPHYSSDAQVRLTILESRCLLSDHISICNLAMRARLMELLARVKPALFVRDCTAQISLLEILRQNANTSLSA